MPRYPDSTEVSAPSRNATALNAAFASAGRHPPAGSYAHGARLRPRAEPLCRAQEQEDHRRERRHEHGEVLVLREEERRGADGDGLLDLGAPGLHGQAVHAVLLLLIFLQHVVASSSPALASGAPAGVRNHGHPCNHMLEICDLRITT